MCMKMITVKSYGPCGCNSEDEQITDCDDLAEDNCPGVRNVYMGSSSHSTDPRTGNTGCPTHGSSSNEQVEEEPAEQEDEDEDQQQQQQQQQQGEGEGE